MAIKHIKKDKTETVEIGGEGSEWVLNKGVKIEVVGDTGIYNPFADRLSLTIEGRVAVTDPNLAISAVRLLGEKNSLEVTETGRLAGYTAAKLEGDRAHVVNDGKMISNTPVGTAIAGFTDGFQIENNGKIAGSNGIDIIGHGKLVNGEDGLISGFQAVRVMDDGASRFINHGRIIGEGWALIAGEGNDRLVNRGHMEGAIDMAGGIDHIDLRRGEALGLVIGGTGNDVFFIDDSDVEVRESDGEGYDIIWTTASYALQDDYSEFEFLGAKGVKNISLTGNSDNNKLAGNAGNNKLFGNAGEDTFYAGAGKDRLSGGSESDTFVFRKGDGHDKITDFAFEGSKHDVIDLHFLKGFDNIDDVIAVAKDTDAGLVLKLGKDDSLTIKGLIVDHLDAMQFDFT